ncbi:hypothetical protein GJ744_008156 [Endocarpon pusillum]|uniref:Rhodopsin domain-containing protein n=1 Tax=Endocarpon pusillum TaxID=364733 RepID=A0A8H7E4N9_9EURO|nr:hypothetical protein GJ744_008156 [Endocarpon pusillum]
MPPYNDRCGTVYALAAVTGSLSLLSVVLRFIARSRKKAPYGPDDWWASTSLVTLLAWNGLVIWTAQHGWAYDNISLPPPILTAYLKGIYFLSLSSGIPLTAAKFSVLCLYRRLFYLEKRFCTATTIVGVLCLLWFISFTVAASLICIPVDRFWNRLKPGSCYNYYAFMVAVECPNSFLDFVIVALPVGVIRGLHLPLRRRILVCFIFALGGFVGVIGFIRISILYRPNTLNSTLLGYWLQIQLSIAVICTSLPTYGPILPSVTRVKGWYPSMSSVFQKRRQNSCSSSSSPNPKMALVPKLQESSSTTESSV